MSDRLPENVIDGRITGSPHVNIPFPRDVNAEQDVQQYIEGITAPRPPERTEIAYNEIVLAISSHQVCRYQRRRFDIFDKRWVTHTDEVWSGNRKVVFQSGGDEFTLDSDFDIRRESGMPEDIRNMFSEIGTLPGNAVTLDREKRQGRIIHLFDLERHSALWDRLRRRAATLRRPIFIGVPASPIVVRFKNEADLATWEWAMRILLESNYTTPHMDHRVCKDYQNASDIRTRQALAESGQVRLRFADANLERRFYRDMKSRSEHLEGGPSRYPTSGFLNPELAGCAEADFTTRMPDLL
jgi:hypothetical protein